MKINEIVNYLESKYPSVNAQDIDTGKIGLQFGSMNASVKKAIIALDGTIDVVNEAIEKKAELIILHHPFLFYPILSINYDSPFGQKINKLITNKINVFSMHTNFDVAKDGMNDILANILGLKNIKITDEQISSKTLIRIGTIDEMKLSDFAKYVSSKLEEPTVRFVGDENKKIKKVGIVGGAGASEMYKAFYNDCDVLITGEVHHHQALDAKEYNIALVEVSHSVERHFASKIKEELENEFPDVEFIISKNNINPFNSL